MDLFFEKVTIIGVGLLGGSVGLALKDKGLCEKIVGLGRSSASIQNGIRIGAIDEAENDLSKATHESDLIVVCTPVGSVAGLIAEMESSIEDSCIITDVGSTKGDIVSEVSALKRAGKRFVGGHPLAGAEKKGVQHASADLFNGATIFLTPAAVTDADATEKIAEMWKRFGGKVIETDPEAHDRIVAQTSHLPHVVAALLVAGLRAIEEDADELVGRGFLDVTRIASSDPEMWADICMSNVEEIRNAALTLKNDLEEFDMFLEEGEYEKILEFFSSVKSMRDSLNTDI